MRKVKQPTFSQYYHVGAAFCAVTLATHFELEEKYFITLHPGSTPPLLRILNPCETTLYCWSTSLSNSFESYRIPVKVPEHGGLLVIQTDSKLSQDVESM